MRQRGFKWPCLRYFVRSTLYLQEFNYAYELYQQDEGSNPSTSTFAVHEEPSMTFSVLPRDVKTTEPKNGRDLGLIVGGSKYIKRIDYI